jgi:hypothetical protein
VRATERARLVGKERGMDAAEHDIRTCRTRRDADLVAAQRIAGVDADANDVARRDDSCVEALEGLVDQTGLTESDRRCRGQHIEPARGNNADTERHMTGIDKVNGHPYDTMTAPA